PDQRRPRRQNRRHMESRCPRLRDIRTIRTGPTIFSLQSAEPAAPMEGRIPRNILTLTIMRSTLRKHARKQIALSWLLALAAAFLLNTARAGEPADELTPIFNGSDFTGWQVPEPNPFWRIEESVLIGETDEKLR